MYHWTKVSLTLLAFASPTSACSGVVAQSAGREANMIKMNVSTNQTREKLKVTYEVTNESSETVYLQNHLIGEDEKEGLVPDRNAAVVKVNGKTVSVGKIPPPLSDMTVLMNPLPTFITVLKPGAKFQETIELSLPIRPFTPYDPRPFEGREVAESNELEFSLSYAPKSPHGKVEEGTYHGKKVTKLVRADEEVPAAVPDPGPQVITKKLPLKVPVYVK